MKKRLIALLVLVCTLVLSSCEAPSYIENQFYSEDVLSEGLVPNLPKPNGEYLYRTGTSSYCDKIYIWDYPYDYVATNAIFPILHTLREDVRYYVEHSVKGMFINGQTDASDFDDLKIRFATLGKIRNLPEIVKLKDELKEAFLEQDPDAKKQAAKDAIDEHFNK